MSPRRSIFRYWRVRPRERFGELLAILGMLSLLLLFMTRPEWEDPSWQIAWAAGSAVAAGAPFRPAYLALILASLVGIQAGANLFKGYFEGLDRSAPPSSPGSWFAFDSGGAVGLTRDPRTVLRVGHACFALGVASGLALVVLTGNVLLLVFGVAGAVLAWTYSSPPLKLSYRGVGEVSTFLAFGPIMTVGAAVAFGDVGWTDSLIASIVLGSLASAISFVRYFPNREEDLSKGKHTPVTILGVRRATLMYRGLLAAPLVAGVAWALAGRLMVWPIVLLAFIGGIAAAFPPDAAPSEAYERAIALTVAAHMIVALTLVADLVLRL